MYKICKSYIIGSIFILTVLFLHIDFAYTSPYPTHPGLRKPLNFSIENIYEEENSARLAFLALVSGFSERLGSVKDILSSSQALDFIEDVYEDIIGNIKDQMGIDLDSYCIRCFFDIEDNRVLLCLNDDDRIMIDSKGAMLGDVTIQDFESMEDELVEIGRRIEYDYSSVKPIKSFEETENLLSEIIKDTKKYSLCPKLIGGQLRPTNSSSCSVFQADHGHSSFLLFMKGFSRKEAKGWTPVIVNTYIRNGEPVLVIRLTKEGRDPVIKFFRIGPGIRKLAYTGKGKGESLEVIDIVEVNPLSGLIKDVDFDWGKDALGFPGLEGWQWPLTDEDGTSVFYPMSNRDYRFRLSFRFGITGERAKGWKPVIVNSYIRNNRPELVIRLTKKGEDPVIRFFRIGPETRQLSYSGKDEGGPFKVLDIININPLSEIIKGVDSDWERHASGFPDLRGYSLSITNKDGASVFYPHSNFPFALPMLNFKGETAKGWKPTIVSSYLEKGIFNLTVRLTKKDMSPRVKHFQIYHFIRQLKGYHEEEGNILEVFDISDSFCLRILSELISNVDINWKRAASSIPKLTGTRTGALNSLKGTFFLTPPGSALTSNWPALGFGGEYAKGWKGVVIYDEVKAEGLYFTVKFVRKYRKPIIQRFYIGRLLDYAGFLKIVKMKDIEKSDRISESIEKGRAWDYDSMPVFIDYDTISNPLKWVEFTELQDAFKRLTEDMMIEDEIRIAQQIMDGEEDTFIAEDNNCALWEVDMIRKSMRAGLSDFAGPLFPDEAETIEVVSLGSPASFFKTIYERHRSKVVSSETLMKELKVNMETAQRDINRLYKSGLIDRIKKDGHILVKSTLKGIIMIEELYTALYDLGTRPTVAEVQYVTRTIIEKYGGTIEVKPGGVFYIKFPTQGYNLIPISNHKILEKSI